MSKKLRIAVVMGGTSNERGVSLNTGKQIIKNLNKSKYLVKKYDTKTQLKNLFTDCANKKIDVCVLALHGKGGEDGTIQGMLDLLDTKYTGSGTMSSALSMDKIMSKKVLSYYPSIPLPKDIDFDIKQWKQSKVAIINKIARRIKFPAVVKPNVSGSSVGVAIVKNKTQLERGINDAFKHDCQVIVEEFIDGIEITVPILDDQTLPVIEICPKNKFFDYEAKYKVGYCDEIVPARINSAQAKSAQALSLKVHQILGCSGLTRVDLILRNHTPYVLEINTLPGMTKTSLCPQSAAAAGISFTKLLDKIIQLAK